MTWREEDHPRWPIGTPTRGDVGPGRFRDADNPTGWLAQVGGRLAGRMTHAELESYVDRKDYTVDPDFTHGGQSAVTQLRVYSDGRRLIAKYHDDGEYFEGEDDPWDVEVKTSYIGWAVGAPVPAVVNGDELGLTLSEYIPARTAAQVLPSDQATLLDVPGFAAKELALAKNAGGSVELGLLDLLIGNMDRHPMNWLLDGNGQAWGIDHANAVIGTFGTNSPFTQWFADRAGRLIDNPMTQSQIDAIIGRFGGLHDRGIITEDELDGLTVLLEDVRMSSRPG